MISNALLHTTSARMNKQFFWEWTLPKTARAKWWVVRFTTISPLHPHPLFFTPTVFELYRAMFWSCDPNSLPQSRDSLVKSHSGTWPEDRKLGIGQKISIALSCVKVREFLHQRMKSIWMSFSQVLCVPVNLFLSSVLHHIPLETWFTGIWTDEWSFFRFRRHEGEYNVFAILDKAFLPKYWTVVFFFLIIISLL